MTTTDTPEKTVKPIAIIGLGYVGLPLAVEFGRHRPVIGFDINPARIAELNTGFDRTREVEPDHLTASTYLRLTHTLDDIRAAQIYIVTVPTPVDAHKRPDLTPILKATATVGRVLKRGDIVIYESTVYPGCTEEDCVPVLERESGLRYNEEFFCGYSPERINPGDKHHTLTKIRKVTAGSTPAVAAEVDALYGGIITAGTYCASSIRVAEAAKVIENCQRDINIAFVNELALIFNRLGIDTVEVLEAAGTKWNFLPFRPGLVGGHCIGVDPYYLTHKAESLGYHPQIILSGRRINDNMGAFVAGKVVKLLIRHNCVVNQSRVLVLGMTFKENCPDIRNSRVTDILHELHEFGVSTDVFDPMADAAEVKHEYGIDLLTSLAPETRYQAVILAVAHQPFLTSDFLAWLGGQTCPVYDVKSCLPLSLGATRL
jgi:UDP-N-acetyl-D-glucosamine/UDP-N-acetyl-D-galactosamine dehydrogenase